MNGHRPVLSKHSTFQPYNVQTFFPSNPFAFMRFRTLYAQRSARNSFPLNHFRTLSHAMEGWGNRDSCKSPSCVLLQLNRHSQFTPGRFPLFSTIYALPNCNSFILKTLQQYPGVCTP